MPGIVNTEEQSASPHECHAYIEAECGLGSSSFSKSEVLQRAVRFRSERFDPHSFCVECWRRKSASAPRLPKENVCLATMVGKLCRQASRSHLIPRAYYKFLRTAGAPDPDPITAGTEVTRTSQDQLVQHLLCEACEDLLNQHGGYR